MKDAANRRRPWSRPESAGSDGLVGVGGDLLPGTLLRAYADGVFPWFNDGDPILWWSPDPRTIFELDRLHISRSLARILRSGRFRVTINRDFAAVIRKCGERRDDGTWVTAEIIAAYEALHRLGHAHSVETWVPADPGQPPAIEPPHGWRLAGGIYGVAVGGLFAGESMFYRVADASKVALVALVDRLRERGFELFDIQMRTEHTTRLGAVDLPRPEYLARLHQAVRKPNVTFDRDA